MGIQVDVPVGKPVRKVLGKCNYYKVYAILGFSFSTHYNVELNETNGLPIIFPAKNRFIYDQQRITIQGLQAW